jgi:hypothetical protein
MAGVQFLTGARDFSLIHSVETSFEAHPISHAMGAGGYFSGDKVAGV